MRELLTAVGLFLLLNLVGCAQMFTCSTEIDYEAGKWHYKSCKNQENLVADLSLDGDGKMRTFNVSTTAITPEAAIAAALQVQSDLLRQLIPILQKGAMAGS